MGSKNNDPAERLMRLIAGGVSGTTVAIGLVVVLLIATALTSFYTVESHQRAVVTRFGAYHEVQGPGLRFKLPLGIDQVERVPVTSILTEEFGFRTRVGGARSSSNRQDYIQAPEHLAEALMLTGDLNVVEVQWVVQYQIAKPVAYLHHIHTPKRTIRDVSEAVVRRIVGNRLLSEILSGQGRTEISGMAKEEIARILDEYEMGVSIRTVELQDVVPPATVRPSYNAVNEAQQERERLINEAEKRRNQEIPRAKGEAEQLINEAEGYRAERVNRALGDASRFQAVAQEYRQSPDITRRRLYLETLDKVLPKAGQVYVIEPGSASPLPLMNLDRSRGAK